MRDRAADECDLAQARDEVRNLNVTLEQRVKERTSALGRALDDATALLASNAPGSPAAQVASGMDAVTLIASREGLEGKNDITVSATLATASASASSKKSPATGVARRTSTS